MTTPTSPASPAQAEPPFIPLRHTRWATRRTPWWVFGVLLVLVAGGVLVSLAVTPSTSQKASDLSGYFGDVNAGIESCAGGARDSATAYNKVLGGDRADYSNALGILAYNAQNCSPANNQPLQDFDNYQVTESLAQFPLTKADDDLISWAFDAQATQTDMLAVLKATTPAGRAAALATLRKDTAVMDAKRAVIDAVWNNAKKTTGSTAAIPFLPL